jgi:hypothetical protein
MDANDVLEAYRGTLEDVLTFVGEQEDLFDILTSWIDQQDDEMASEFQEFLSEKKIEREKRK